MRLPIRGLPNTTFTLYASSPHIASRQSEAVADSDHLVHFCLNSPFCVPHGRPSAAYALASRPLRAALTQNTTLLTVIETPAFTRLWPDYWNEDERGDFVAWLVENTQAGDVIRGSGGCRKVRWKRPGTGKRGGVRVIHYNRLADGTIYLLLIYAKGVRDDIDAKTLDGIRRTLDGEDD